MEIKRVGIIRGGTGEHYESSLKKGGDIILHIIENLSDKYKPVDILIDKKGNWHANGLPIDYKDLVNKIDLAWNTIQHPDLSFLDDLYIPKIVNESILKTIKDNVSTKTYLKSIGVEIPRSIILPLYQKDFDGPQDAYVIKKAKEIFEKFSAPWIVKSYTSDSNMGIHLAKTFPELVSAIEDGVEHKKSILIEEFIAGKVASVHTVPLFRGQDIYAFPLGNSFGTFSSIEKDKLGLIAKELHRYIGNHYLKCDFVLNKKGKVYLLNIESTLDFKPESHFSQVCESVGAKIHHVVDHILEKALSKKM